MARAYYQKRRSSKRGSKKPVKSADYGERSERRSGFLNEGGLHAVRHRRRRQDCPVGARNPDAVARRKPYAGAAEVDHRREKLSAPFDFPRFLGLMSKHLKPEPFDRQLRDAFKVIDKDGTGCVVVSDLRHILTSIGEKLEPAEFDEWIREVDIGSDGKIRYEDFIARMVAK
ncbi:hypothetical protein SASPL_157369 [Salvia splendens]|uniref:EF-hand domain-containing protein n=1 Tax=Salvia splendens TaxID=180675 RepID=A0A8X8VUZ8_SALSN|nr:hypothetical protein SASPL_157369 [Salvia splendens]